jgi:hypothetical protein
MKKLIQNIQDFCSIFLFKKIIATDNSHLKSLIKKEIDKNGFECDLNHIDVSNIKDFSKLFSHYNVSGINEKPTNMFKFNGNISKWDLSNAETMYAMFWESEFNGDISSWNISNVKNMQAMFFNSQFNGNISSWDTSNIKNMSSVFAASIFNGDISSWDVSNVETMQHIFYEAEFNGDISNWRPWKLKELKDAFKNSNTNPPYWAKFEDQQSRISAINNYLLMNDLNKNLLKKQINKKKLKV